MHSKRHIEHSALLPVLVRARALLIHWNLPLGFLAAEDDRVCVFAWQVASRDFAADSIIVSAFPRSLEELIQSQVEL
jgi:hypothetical protein